MKRSSQVALLLMGAGAVGGTSYAVAPQRNCSAQTQQAAAAPDASAPRPQSSCGSRWSSHFGSGGWSRRSTSAPPGGQSGIATTSRGGFGSIGRFFSGGG